MRLVCPNCSSQYEVDAALFPDEGREVQCSNCEEVWFQYPVAEEPPLRLDGLAAAPRDEPAPARPSERLDRSERDELARAAREEVSIRDTASFLDDTEADGEEDDAILSQLRHQIKQEGGDFEKGGAAQSQKRNLKAAAESAGIDVAEEAEDERKGRRWGFSMEEDEAPKTGLAAALRGLEEEDREIRAYRRRGRLRSGFVTAVVLVGIGFAVYAFQREIAELYPPAAPYLAQYDGIVNQGRAQAETLYAQYQPMVMDMISDLTSGDAAASE